MERKKDAVVYKLMVNLIVLKGYRIKVKLYLNLIMVILIGIALNYSS